MLAEQPTFQKNETRGNGALMFATVLYGMYGVYSRWLHEDFGAFTQNWVRNLIIVFLLLGYFVFRYLRSGKWYLKLPMRSDWTWMIIWLSSGVFVLPLIYVTFNNLQIGASYLPFYTGTIAISYLGGKVMYQEKMNRIKYISLFLAIIGLILTYAFDGDFSSKPFYVFLSLISGILAGIYGLLSKKFSNKYGGLNLVAIDSAYSVVVIVAVALIAGESVPRIEFSDSWLVTVVFALSHILAISLFLYGYKHTEAQIASIILLLEALFGALFGYIFFGEVMSLATVVGGLMILIAAVLPSLKYVYRQYFPKIA